MTDRSERSRESIVVALKNNADKAPESAAFHWVTAPFDEAEHVGKAQFGVAIQRFAAYLEDVGIEPGETVSLLLPNIWQAHAILWASTAIAVANPVNFILRPDDIVDLLDRVRTRVLVVPGPGAVHGIWEKVDAIRHRLPHIRRIVTVGASSDGCDNFDAIVAADERPLAAVRAQRSGSDIAVLFHTGGTTGLPKIVPLSHANILAAARSLGAAMRFGPDDLVYNGLPIFHVAGSLLIGLGPLLAGSAMLLVTEQGLRAPSVIGAYWWIVEHYRPTVIGGIPTSLAALTEVSIGGADLRSVRLCLTGGAPLPATLAEQFAAHSGFAVHQIYGMTEASGLIATTAADAQPRPGFVGMASPGTEIAIRERMPDGTAGALLPVGTTGLICFRGPQLFAGYADADAVDDDGWLNSGDMGQLDASGWLSVTGRAKEVIIRSGHNIDPAMIEEAAMRHPAIASCAAVGMPDRYAGELPVLFVTLKAGRQEDVESIERHLQDEVAERPAWPKLVLIRDALPLTAVGKVAKNRLQEAAADIALYDVIEQLSGAKDAGVIIRCELQSSGTMRAAVISPSAEISSSVARALQGFNIDLDLQVVSG